MGKQLGEAPDPISVPWGPALHGVLRETPRTDGADSPIGGSSVI